MDLRRRPESRIGFSPRTHEPSNLTLRPSVVSRYSLRLALSIMPLCAACSPSPYSSDVSGLVTLDNSPIGPGVVIFVPADPKKDPSRGAIDPKGRYFMKTKQDRGIDSGSYRVAVQVYDLSNAPAPGERQWEKPDAIVPTKYLETGTSGLEFDVENGKNTIDLELTSEDHGS